MEQIKSLPKMQPEVDAKFNCVKVLPGEVIWKNRLVDIRNIDVATATQLVSEKFPYLVPKVASPSSNSTKP